MKNIFTLLLMISFASSAFCQINKAQAPLEVQNEELFKVVENMPLFPGCESIEGRVEKKECSNQNMLTYLYKNLKYPAEARINKTEGMVVVSFVVRKDGSLDNIEILREIGDGCEEEAKRVVESMNHMSQKWEPGNQRGKKVSVIYTLPVRFKLEGKNKAITKSDLIRPANNENTVVDQNMIKFFEGSVYIDGVLKNVKALEALNSNDIESMDIIKGEKATEMFGVNHNLGVIKVETKK